MLRRSTVCLWELQTLVFIPVRAPATSSTGSPPLWTRDRSWVVDDAIDSYLELRRWQKAEIEQGIADSDAGRSFTLEQVREQLAHLHAATKSRESASPDTARQ